LICCAQIVGNAPPISTQIPFKFPLQRPQNKPKILWQNPQKGKIFLTGEEQMGNWDVAQNRQKMDVWGMLVLSELTDTSKSPAL